MSFLRAFSVLCAVSTVMNLVLWIVDRIEDVTFPFGWLLLSSVVWMVVSWTLYRFLKRRKESAGRNESRHL